MVVHKMWIQSLRKKKKFLYIYDVVNYELLHDAKIYSSAGLTLETTKNPSFAIYFFCYYNVKLHLIIIQKYF